MIRRTVEALVSEAMADTPVVLLNGARQTGKTTLARAIAGRAGAQYYTLDDAATLSAAAGDPRGFVRGLSRPAVIDEVQKAPGLFPAIKLAVDRDREPGMFLLTGSANVMSLPRLADSLVGRMELIPLFPFSAGERLGVTEQAILRLFAGTIAKTKRIPSAQDLPSRLAIGGYPEVVQRPSERRRAAWFGSYVSTLLMRDVRDLARVDALHALPNLLKLLASRSSGLLNVSSLGRDTGLPHTTLTRYLALLDAVFLVHRLPAWSHNLGKRLVKAPKIHLMDTGLACHVIGADARRLAEDRTLFGQMLETFVVGELRKQASWTQPPVTLHHLRTASGSEVDVVLERADGSLAAIEVKASASVATADFTALRALRDVVGKRMRAGVILYTGDEIVPFGDRLWVAPISVLWAA